MNKTKAFFDALSINISTKDENSGFFLKKLSFLDKDEKIVAFFEFNDYESLLFFLNYVKKLSFKYYFLSFEYILSSLFFNSLVLKIKKIILKELLIDEETFSKKIALKNEKNIYFITTKDSKFLENIKKITFSDNFLDFVWKQIKLEIGETEAKNSQAIETIIKNDQKQLKNSYENNHKNFQDIETIIKNDQKQLNSSYKNNQKIFAKESLTTKEIFLKNKNNSNLLTDFNLDNVKVNDKISLNGILIFKDLAIKKSWHVLNLLITDNNNNFLSCEKLFQSNSFDKTIELYEEISEEDIINVEGIYQFNSYSSEYVCKITSFKKIKGWEIWQGTDNNRSELLCHTNMCAMDGVSSVESYVKKAIKSKLKSIAFLDNVSVHSFPDIYKFQKKYGNDIKFIYGVQLEIIDEEPNFILNSENKIDLEPEGSYILFDLETTGLYPQFNEIIEFAGIKIKDGKEVERLEILIKPKVEVNSFITSLTKITNEMLKNKNSIENEIRNIQKFLGDSVLVAHNAIFDFGFLNFAFEKYLNTSLKNIVIDTLALSRSIVFCKKHNLANLSKELKVPYDALDKAHRAIYDTEILRDCFFKLLKIYQEKYQSKYHQLLKDKLALENFYQKTIGFSVSCYCKNQDGVKDLYKILSLSLTDYLYKKPKIFASVLKKYQNNILISTTDFRSEHFYYFSLGLQNIFLEKLKKYNFLTIEAPSNYLHFISDNAATDISQLNIFLSNFYKFLKKTKMIVCCVSNSYFVSKYEHEIREILINTKGISGTYHYLSGFDLKKYPENYLKNEAIFRNEFSFLSKKEQDEIIIDNPNKIASLITPVIPVKSKLYSPNYIKDPNKELIKFAKFALDLIYGSEVDPIILERFDKEIKILTKNNYSEIYLIAKSTIEQAEKLGSTVGSRGSVGSSFIAFLLKITEVNPLKPHYYCKSCKYTEFSSESDCGFDLPPKKCPKCNELMFGDGINIPFETFLGFDGDKIPDIDLNFPSSIQAEIHNYIKKTFGKNSVLRAGTTSTIATKTAFAFVKSYLDKKEMTLPISYRNFLIKKMEGIRRTTGQHPGGILIIPKKYKFEDFTPIAYPADDKSSEWYTSHFTIDTLHDNLLKLDLLGHLDPEILLELEKLTSKKFLEIKFFDKKVLELFLSNDSINLKYPEFLGYKKNSGLGIPNFGTFFVRDMLNDIRVRNFSDLIRVSGLSHGTNVWISNNLPLVKKNKVPLEKIVSCRDDIMIQLMDKKIDKMLSFTIMEKVRKGIKLSNSEINELKFHNIDDWYIESLLKIEYLFPKAHAAAYVIMAWRIAWYKVYYPLEFYAVTLSYRCDIFDIEVMTSNVENIHKHFQKLLKKAQTTVKKTSSFITNKRVSEASAKEQQLLVSLEICLELYCRGYKILMCDLKESSEFKFKISKNDNAIIAPFLTINGLGSVVAKNIVEERKKGFFTSIEDFKNRTKVQKPVIDFLKTTNFFQKYNLE
ncbi:PolC-type DNA polymerase III [symbiont of Argiope bruennichi]|uniref:PolC-type DNA polymerase III n=1 Tax=symbiont of Argiope bruennichi TaxID=2810479 RepID=UPI003DA36747